MTPVELFPSVVGVLANALALTPILMSVGFLVLLLWRQLTPLVAKASLGADPIGRAGVCRMLSTLCRTRGTRTKRRSCGGGLVSQRLDLLGRANHAHAGDHSMRGAREHSQHAGRISGIHRLAQDFMFGNHDGIRAEDEAALGL